MKRLSRATTPEEIKARLRARDAAKKRRKNARRRAELAALQTKQISKTSVFYRRMLPPLPQMTKGELRAMLAQAVMNTQESRP